MGMTGFVMWFIAALLVTMLLEVTVENPFVTSFIVATVIGVLGAKE